MTEGKGFSLRAAPAKKDRPLLVRAFSHTALSTELSDSRLYGCTIEADPEPRQSNPRVLSALAQGTIMEKLLNEYSS